MDKKTKLINIETGHILDIDCTDELLSDAYKAVCLKLKELEPIKEALNKAILDRLQPGDKKFANFWDVQNQERQKVVYPDEAHEKKIKSMIEELQRPYQSPYNLQILKFPRY